MNKIHFYFFCLFTGCTTFVNAQNDWENPQLVSLNTDEPHAHYLPYASEAAALKNEPNGFTQSLDGVWSFYLDKTTATRSKLFQNDDYDISKWAKINVPGNWEAAGYQPDESNSVGSYKRSFTVAKEWVGKDVYIHFGGINSFFYLWINGNYVGFSKDSKTPAEFNITSYLRKGENTVSLQVFRFSDGKYLEGQDTWQLSGIERGVYLIARPKQCIIDYTLKGDLDKNYTNGLFIASIQLKTGTKVKSGGYLEVKILDDSRTNKVVWVNRQRIETLAEFTFSTSIDSVRKWNAEFPELYTVVINHLDNRGKVIESFVQKLGFRKVEIKHGLLLVNGVAIEIKGVNRQEHDRINGKLITRESMLKDILRMKAFNINAVRTSHYPNNEEWYKLCDQYGIYVVDEANIDCSGMQYHGLKTVADKPEWKDAFMDRTKRMYERDKNFTSIIIWSLGNESGFGENLMATYTYLKSVDSSRPVQYEGVAGDQLYTDIVCPKYKDLSEMMEYAKEYRAKPFVQCEYSPMSGNSGGNLADDWKLIYKYKQLQGGFTADFTSTGTLYPQAYEVQKVFQNVSIQSVPLSVTTFTIENRFDYSNLKDYSVSWKVVGDGATVTSGVLEEMVVEPHQFKTFGITIPEFRINPGTEYFLLFEVKSKMERGGLKAGSRIAWEQFKLPTSIQASKNTLNSSFGRITMETKDSMLNLLTATTSVSFNVKTGFLRSCKVDGKELLKDGLHPNFWRPATDNDIAANTQNQSAMWQYTEKDIQLKSFHYKATSVEDVTVTVDYYLPQVDADYSIVYVYHVSGDLKVDVTLKAGEKNYPELPRFGMRLLLKDEFATTSWLGCGPFDNYCDRNSGSPIGVYQMPVDSLFYPYPKAQESGNRTNVRWMSMCNVEGRGLMAVGDNLNMGATHFNMHGAPIETGESIWWNIDLMQMGVGNGAKPYSDYLIPYEDYHYSFILRPVHVKTDLIDLSKVRH